MGLLLYRFGIYYNHGTLTGKYGPVEGRDLAVQVGEEQLGDWGEWLPFGPGEIRHCSRMAHFVALQEFTFGRLSGWQPDGEPRTVKAGEMFTITAKGAVRETRGLPDGHDVCSYCGFDNTEAGGRECWDCLSCGGN